MKYEIYKNLSKEEKKAVKIGYLNTKKGDYILKKINRLLIYSIIYLILGIVLSILLYLDYFNKLFIILAVALFICSIVFYIGHYNLKMQQYCKYINLCHKLAEVKAKQLEDRKKKKK
jgi:polyferredoxin